MIKRKTCSVEGCNSLVWKQGKCIRHTDKAALKQEVFLSGLKQKTLKAFSQKHKQTSEEQKQGTREQMKLFLEIWDERCDDHGNNYCFETGRLLKQEYYRNNSSCYHHCLFKEKYPQYRFLKENVIIIHPDIHTQIHTDVDKTPKTKKYTLDLKNKLLSLE